MTTLTPRPTAPPEEPSAQPTQTTPRRRRPWWRSKEAIAAYIFIGPMVVLFGLFRVWPALHGIVLAFGDYSLRRTYDFVGVDHFVRLFQDPIFWDSLRVTFIFAAIQMPLAVIVSLAMAQLCNRVMRGMAVYRSVFFLPTVTSSVLIALVFMWIFSGAGPVNAILDTVGIEPVGWLTDKFWVLFTLAILSVWSSFGYNMLILLAGMLSIPQEYYEAASIDGANGWQKFWHITLPNLKPALFFVLVIETIKSLQTFDTIFVMTGGGPARGSYTLTFMIYDQGFGYFDFGYASAAGVVLLIITLVLSLLQRKLVGKND
ncbi:carbohydrate ABC transporter permease [Microbacterium sp. JB110]|uniref:carbohydrate ABC transporter permease n=1 Tax=Microbacterium sp. JB110 TaxID=2024477 RepID=UPI00097F1194|nr:sugar ABC transporter permease [Microbacterium sp. JB110]RCS60081.1 sugar ABC transporter permease [Microbacterium sp. JB110]SJM45538.1 N-Acetyl-D-glucosamine ABC transport system, permease protein 1 [Frigoribacterium sp. JB110]